MYDEVSSSNPPDLPVPAEGAYVWHLEVIVVAVRNRPHVTRVRDRPSCRFRQHKKKKKKGLFIIKEKISICGKLYKMI
jgi:hypothetical protein